jgi:hypothetical protein
MNVAGEGKPSNARSSPPSGAAFTPQAVPPCAGCLTPPDAVVYGRYSRERGRRFRSQLNSSCLKDRYRSGGRVNAI